MKLRTLFAALVIAAVPGVAQMERPSSPPKLEGTGQGSARPTPKDEPDYYWVGYTLGCYQVAFVPPFGYGAAVCDIEGVNNWNEWFTVEGNAATANCQYAVSLRAQGTGSSSELFAMAYGVAWPIPAVEFDEWIYPDGDSISFGDNPTFQDCNAA
jgi:hypothetical protein